VSVPFRGGPRLSATRTARAQGHNFFRSRSGTGATTHHEQQHARRLDSSLQNSRVPVELVTRFDVWIASGTLRQCADPLGDWPHSRRVGRHVEAHPAPEAVRWEPVNRRKTSNQGVEQTTVRKLSSKSANYLRPLIIRPSAPTRRMTKLGPTDAYGCRRVHLANVPLISRAES
jgi:hypothetical protein